MRATAFPCSASSASATATSRPCCMRGDAVEPEVGSPRRTTGRRSVSRSADETLADYEARGGLAALRALPMPRAVVAELKASGLAGYGGAGFPTGRQVGGGRSRAGAARTVLNADEGEPGTIKDRYLMERRPHLVLEGVADRDARRGGDRGVHLPARGVRAARGSGSRPRSTSSAPPASSTGSTIRLVIGAGAYICGEETAMLESMEGRRGMPRLKPPFPSQVGYLGRPTLINNVETLAHIPAILRHGRRGVGGARRARRERRAALVGDGRGREARLLRGAERLDAPRAHRAGGRRDGGGRRDRPGGAASGILPPAALDVPLVRDDALRDGAPGSARPACRCSPRAIRRCASSPRRCASSPRSRARSARRAGSATAASTTSWKSSSTAASRCRASRSRSGSTRWCKTSICGLGQGAPFPVRNAFRYWPELFAPLGEPVETG